MNPQNVVPVVLGINPPMDRPRLITRLKLKEGYKLTAYKDSRGFWTICVGHLLGPAPVPASADCEQCEKYLTQDIDEAEREAKRYSFYADLVSPLQNIVVELTFNLSHKLDGFHRFLAAMETQDYTKAGCELKSSLAYTQEPHRMDELIKALSSGSYPLGSDPVTA